MFVGGGGAGKTTLKTALLLRGDRARDVLLQLRQEIRDTISRRWTESDLREWVDTDLARETGFFSLCTRAKGISGESWLRYTHHDIVNVFGAPNNEVSLRVVRKMAAVLCFFNPDAFRSSSLEPFGWLLDTIEGALDRIDSLFGADPPAPDTAYGALLDIPHVWTEAVELDDSWSEYTLWDFPGQMELYPAHRLFLACETAVYVLVVNAMSNPRVQLDHWLSLIRAGMVVGGDKIAARIVVTHTDTLDMVERSALLRDLHDHALSVFGVAFDFGDRVHATDYSTATGGDVDALRDDLMLLRTATRIQPRPMPAAYQAVCDDVLTLARERKRWPVVPVDTVDIRGEAEVLPALEDLGFLRCVGNRLVLEPVTWLSRLMAAFLHPYHGVGKKEVVSPDRDHHLCDVVVTGKDAFRIVNLRGKVVDREHEAELLPLLAEFDLCFRLGDGYVFPMVLPSVTSVPSWLEPTLELLPFALRYAPACREDVLPPTVASLLIKRLLGTCERLGGEPVFFGRGTAVVMIRGGCVGLHLAIDNSSIDVFANQQPLLSIAAMHTVAIAHEHYRGLKLRKLRLARANDAEERNFMVSKLGHPLLGRCRADPVTTTVRTGREPIGPDWLAAEYEIGLPVLHQSAPRQSESFSRLDEWIESHEGEERGRGDQQWWLLFEPQRLTDDPCIIEPQCLPELYADPTAHVESSFNTMDAPHGDVQFGSARGPPLRHVPVAMFVSHSPDGTDNIDPSLFKEIKLIQKQDFVTAACASGRALCPRVPDSLSSIVEDLLALSKERIDNLVVLFCGHGGIDGIVCSNGEIARVETLAKWVAKCKPVCVIYNICHGEAVAAETRRLAPECGIVYWSGSADTFTCCEVSVGMIRMAFRAGFSVESLADAFDAARDVVSNHACVDYLEFLGSRDDTVVMPSDTLRRDRSSGSPLQASSASPEYGVPVIIDENDIMLLDTDMALGMRERPGRQFRVFDCAQTATVDGPFSAADWVDFLDYVATDCAKLWHGRYFGCDAGPSREFWFEMNRERRFQSKGNTGRLVVLHIHYVRGDADLVRVAHVNARWSIPPNRNDPVHYSPAMNRSIQNDGLCVTGRRAVCVPNGAIGRAWRVEYNVIDVWSFALDHYHARPPQPTVKHVTDFVQRFAAAMGVTPDRCTVGFYVLRPKNFCAFNGTNEMGGSALPAQNGFKIEMRVQRLVGSPPFAPTDAQWDSIRDLCRPFDRERDGQPLPQPHPLYTCVPADLGWNPIVEPPEPFPVFDVSIPREKSAGAHCADALGDVERLRRLLRRIDEERRAHLVRARKAKPLSLEELARLKEADDHANQALYKAAQGGDARAVAECDNAFFLVEMKSQWRSTRSTMEERFHRE